MAITLVLLLVAASARARASRLAGLIAHMVQWGGGGDLDDTLLRGPQPAPYRQRKRMVWAERLEDLNDGEFVKRYKVTKYRFRQLCELIEPHVGPRPNLVGGGNACRSGAHNSPLSTELKLSMALRYMCGGGPLDLIDLHGVRSKSTLYLAVEATMSALDKVLPWPGDVRDDTYRN